MRENIVYEKPMYFNSKHYAVETAKLGKEIVVIKQGYLLHFVGQLEYL